MRSKLLILLIFSFSLLGEEVALTEKSLIEMAKKGSTNIDSIEVGRLEARLNELTYRDQFNLNLIGGYSYSDTDEEAIAAFVPIFGPIKTGSVGLNKSFEEGVALTASAFTDQRTAGTSIFNANRTGYNVSLQMSLWKNLFGSVTKKTRENLSLFKKQKDYEAQIFRKAYFTDLRKIYWSLVANQEQTELAEEQLRISRKQLKDIKARFSSKIADKGDVARIQAQVSSREAYINGLKFQKESIIQTLKEQVGELTDKEIKLAPYDIEKTIGTVLACMNEISSHEGVPWSNTLYDEIVSLVDQTYANTQRITKRYNDPEVTLKGEYQESGVGTGFDNAYDRFRDNSGSGAGIGIELTVPLDGKKTKSQTTKEILDEKRYQAAKKSYVLRMKANHTQLVKTIMLLRDIVLAQKANGASLNTSLKVSARKYKQARISLNDYINEQNLFLNSKISEIDAELAVIHNILDYFKVFTETPCKLNKVIL